MGFTGVYRDGLILERPFFSVCLQVLHFTILHFLCKIKLTFMCISLSAKRLLLAEAFFYEGSLLLHFSK